jgi:hypothetical protein
MTRWKASAIHLAISLFLGIAVFSLLFFVWYPGPLFSLTGGDRLMLILIGVDVVIGPALTLAVFKSGKPGMKFDLTMIALFQATAMAYGLGVILIGRPAYLVFEGTQFVVVHANAISTDPKRQSEDPQYRRAGFGGPRTVSLKLPTNEDERAELNADALNGKPVERMPRYYAAYDERIVEVAQSAVDIAELGKKSERALQQAKDVIDAAAADDRLGFVPLIDGTEAGTVIVSRNDGRILKMLPIDTR